MPSCKLSMVVQSKRDSSSIDRRNRSFIDRFRQCVLSYDTLSSNYELLKSVQSLFAFLTLSQVRRRIVGWESWAFYLESCISTGEILVTSQTIVFRTASTTRLSGISSPFIGQSSRRSETHYIERVSDQQSHLSMSNHCFSSDCIVILSKNIWWARVSIRVNV